MKTDKILLCVKFEKDYNFERYINQEIYFLLDMDLNYKLNDIYTDRKKNEIYFSFDIKEKANDIIINSIMRSLREILDNVIYIKNCHEE